MVYSRRELPLWESDPSLGSLLATTKGVLLSPRAFFDPRAHRGGIGLPMLFGVIWGTIGGFFPLLWLQALGGVPFAVPLAYAFLLPPFSALGILLSSALIHLGLTLVGGGKRGFGATLRVVAYSQAVQGWGILPVVGPLLAGVHQAILYVLGLRAIHGVGVARVLIGLLLPVVLGGILATFLLLALLGPSLRPPSLPM